MANRGKLGAWAHGDTMSETMAVHSKHWRQKVGLDGPRNRNPKAHCRLNNFSRHERQSVLAKGVDTNRRGVQQGSRSRQSPKAALVSRALDQRDWS